MASHVVLAVERNFVADARGAFWVYGIQIGTSTWSGASIKVGKGVDYRELLEPEEFGRYAKLREWRKERSQQDGCPPFAILNNEQMAQIILESAELGGRANRGGNWNNSADNCRSGNRNGNEPGNRNNNLGFRPALAPSGDENFPRRNTAD